MYNTIMKVAFIGHQKIKKTKAVRERLTKTIEDLIVNESADTFLFGSGSEFNNLCYEIVTQLKKDYPQIRRVYVRAEYEHIDKTYNGYLLTLYEAIVSAPNVYGAGVLSYIKCNHAVVDLCDILVVFYHENDSPTETKDGTCLALAYAQRMDKRLINVYK